MWAVVVFRQKQVQEFQELLIGLPGFVSQPLLEGADKTLCNAIRLWAMASNDHVHEFGLFGKLLKYLRSKVCATIGNQELQIGW